MPPGAPHYHKYQTKSKDVIVEVFCTPREKVYHFFYAESINPKLCSKVFMEDSCYRFELDSFFEKKKFLKSIRMGDDKFHKLFVIDTLRFSVGDSKSFELFPVD